MKNGSIRILKIVSSEVIPPISFNYTLIYMLIVMIYEAPDYD